MCFAMVLYYCLWVLDFYRNNFLVYIAREFDDGSNLLEILPALWDLEKYFYDLENLG